MAGCWRRLCCREAPGGLSWPWLATGLGRGQGKHGHVPPETHCALIRQIQEVLLARAAVTVLGDGACDGTEVQAARRTLTWTHGGRRAPNLLLRVGAGRSPAARWRRNVARSRRRITTSRRPSSKTTSAWASFTLTTQRPSRRRTGSHSLPCSSGQVSLSPR